MITLINGRGQMGENLKKRLSETSVESEKQVYIYHTWNFEDKTKATQLEEFNKFSSFVDKNYEQKIIFISTSSENRTHYVYYKQMSEAYLINKSKCSISLRFPILIGKKGILTKLKNKEVKPFGVIELMPMSEAIDHIIDKINYTGSTKSFSFAGEYVKATTVQKLLNYK